jgi:hypothetical protein
MQGSVTASRTQLRHARAVLERVQALLKAHPDFAPRYESAKHVVRAFRKPTFYEITQRCNLKCEGCYYFEGGLTTSVPDEGSLADWEEFFAAEARRHVTMAYFVGAEPALEQERLMAAAPWFPYGNIGTNGTIRIDPAIPYRIGVSVWAGDDATDRKLRGAAVFRKAFRNYAGDPRAIILYTLSPWNLKGVRTIAEMCRDHGLPLTFNVYSPTATFLDKLRVWQGNDDQFFRVSRPGDTPCFSPEGLVEARRVIDDLMDEFPDTIVYSKAYNRWITEPGPRYEIDPHTGVAIDCGSRVVGQMRSYSPDRKPAGVKCCTSDVDCSQCRMYSGGWSSKFQPSERDVANEAAFSDWLDMMKALGTIFLYDRDQHAESEPHPLLRSAGRPQRDQAWSRILSSRASVGAAPNGGAASRAQSRS